MKLYEVTNARIFAGGGVQESTSYKHLRKGGQM